MATYFVAESDISTTLGLSCGAAAFAPQCAENSVWLGRVESGISGDALRRPRPAQSAKGLFLPAIESMGRYGADASDTTTVEAGKVVLIGVRACELRARRYLDKVMLEGSFEDADYRRRREATTIVSCDCADCAESCFCTLVGGRPHATEGYDINLTPIAGGFVAEVASDRGRELLGDALLPDATDEQLSARDALRQEMTQRVAAQNERFAFSAADDSPVSLPPGDDEAWGQFAADCVECACCTNICPTCHCFLLYDQSLGEESFERLRTWDSCLLSTYHRMAGGANMKISPQAELSSRLANRVLHKFDYSRQQYGLLGCVGCGRCFDGCLGEIDIRDVVQTLGNGQMEHSQ